MPRLRYRSQCCRDRRAQRDAPTQSERERSIVKANCGRPPVGAQDAALLPQCVRRVAYKWVNRTL